MEGYIGIPKYWPVDDLYTSALVCDLCHFMLRVIQEDIKLRALDIQPSDTMVLTMKYSKWQLRVPFVYFDPTGTWEASLILISDYHKISAPLGRGANIHVAGKLREGRQIPSLIADLDPSAKGSSFTRQAKSTKSFSKMLRFRAAPRRARSNVPPKEAGAPFDTSPSGTLSDQKFQTGLYGDIVKDWLHKCTTYHYDCRSRNSSASPGPSRVIDVRMQAVVDYSHGIQYAALSYVWGMAEPFILSKVNFDMLTTVGGLAVGVCEPTLPKTFRDAMKVTDHLGLRYLWIDALCIQQDNEREKTWEIDIMDSIYEGATVTIVNSTSNAAGGLPRFGENRHLSSPRICVGIDNLDFSLGGPSFAESLWSCPWESRGWTLQEKFFSRRLLVFTPHQVFFHCHEATWSEEDPDDMTLRYDPPRAAHVISVGQCISSSEHIVRS